MNELELLKCICEETRFNVLVLLQKNNEMSVNELVSKLKKDQPLISHHLKSLKQCNLVKTRENGKMTMYSLSNKEISRLVNDIAKVGEKMMACCDTQSCNC